jgi:hypothetical protein
MLKIAVKYGLICSVLMIVPTIVQMIVGMDKLWINGLITFAFFVLMIWLIIKAVKEFRLESENRITFGSAFNIAITSFLIVTLISTGFSFIHQNYIDPEYGQRVKEMTIQKMEEKFNDNPGMSEDQKIAFMEKFENQDPSFTLRKALTMMGWNIGIYLVISLIISASIKKDLNETPIV